MAPLGRRKFNIVRPFREFTRRDGMTLSRKRTGSWPRGHELSHSALAAHAAFVVLPARRASICDSAAENSSISFIVVPRPIETRSAPSLS